MSDLVKRLRKITGDLPPRGHPALAAEAADRIEALEAALREIADDPTGVSIVQAEIARAVLAEGPDK